MFAGRAEGVPATGVVSGRAELGDVAGVDGRLGWKLMMATSERRRASTLELSL
jgi:hypothetical protein